jgi:hypothetical protein
MPDSDLFDHQGLVGFIENGGLHASRHWRVPSDGISITDNNLIGISQLDPISRIIIERYEIVKQILTDVNQ